MWRETSKPAGQHIGAPVLVAEDAHSACGHGHRIATYILPTGNGGLLLMQQRGCEEGLRCV